MKRIPSVALGRHLFVIAGLALASTVGNLLAADTYYVSDHLATTTAVADAAGEIASLEADAFGSPVSGAGQAARYTGKPYDADMGAYVFPFRNYRSGEARWMSADQSGFPDGQNNCLYVNNQILSNVDPLGLATIPVDWTYNVPGTSNDLRIVMSFNLVVNENQLTPSITTGAWTGIWGSGSTTSVSYNNKNYSLSTGSILVTNSGDEVTADGFHHNWITVGAYVNVTITDSGVTSPTSHLVYTSARYYGTAKKE